MLFCKILLIKYKKSDEEDLIQTESRQTEKIKTNNLEDYSESNLGKKRVESNVNCKTSASKSNMKLLFFYLIFPIIFLILSIIIGS